MECWKIGIMKFWNDGMKESDQGKCQMPKLKCPMKSKCPKVKTHELVSALAMVEASCP